MEVATSTRALSPAVARFLPHAITSACAVVIGVGVVERGAGRSLGAPLAPFFAHWRPQAVLLALPCVLLMAAAVVYARRLRERPVSPVAFAAATYGLALALRLALAAARGGPERWSAVFGTDPEAAHEYLPALPALSVGLSTFLDRFAEVAPSLPTHPSGHPPGMLVLVEVLGIRTASGMAALTIGAGTLVVPLTYALARPLLDERGARTAALLTTFAPSALIYGATSADAVYATLAVGAAACLLARGRVSGLAGSVLLGVASFFSFALLGAGAWAALVVRRVWPALAAAAGVIAFYLVLYELTGFDPIGTLHSVAQAYRIGIANARPYWFWLFGSPVAFLVAMGVPLAWYALRALAAGERAAVALASVVIISAALGFTKAETERIWLFLVPLAGVAAATSLPARRLSLVLALLACQALAVELLLGTIW